MAFSVQRSSIDSEYLEIIQEGAVIKEIRVSFLIKKAPPSFDSLEEVEIWLNQSEKRLAKRAAYRWLGGRSYSRVSLLKKLQDRGFSPLVSGEIIDELERLGFLSDEDFLERMIEKEWKRGYGPRYIEMKIRSQGLNVAAVRMRIDEKKQIESIRKFLEKKPNSNRNKTVQFLVRRGFDLEIILKLVD